MTESDVPSASVPPEEVAWRLLCDTVRRSNYKPGSELGCDRVDVSTAKVFVRFDGLVDSRGNSGHLCVTIRRSVDLLSVVDGNDALRECAKVVAAFELHEAAEWLRHDGDVVFEAHENGDEFGHLDWEKFVSRARMPGLSS